MRFLFLAFAAITSLVAAERPNVLLIYTDDQGSIDLGCYGSDDLHTPHLDEFASRGIRFTQMYAPSAICSASRAGLMTGRFPARAGVPSNVSSMEGNSGMPSSEITIAELLKESGYRTGHIGKWHLGYTPETMPNGQGFDRSFGHMGGCIDNYSHFFYWSGPNRHDLWEDGEHVWRDGEYFGDLMANEAIRFIDGETGPQDKDAPFFLYLAINWPHYPMQGTPKWREHYKDHPHPRDKYAIFVSTVDEYVGKLLAHLEASGLAENTLVVFQSDHGHSIEERAFHGGGNPGAYRGHKGNLFEGGIRVPSIAVLPGTIPEGTVSDALVTGCDWWPTIAELAGVEAPADHHLDGRSIVPVLMENAASPHEGFYWQLGKGKHPKIAIREGDWKLTMNNKDIVRPEGVAELTGEDVKGFLVNLKEDPGERKNRAKEEPEIAERLRLRAESYRLELE